MPLLYGEGTRAFLRMQEEILRNHDDETLLAWCTDHETAIDQPLRGLFAIAPAEFVQFRLHSYDNLRGKTNMMEGEFSSISDPDAAENQIVLTNKGAMVTAPFSEDNRGNPGDYLIMVLKFGRGRLSDVTNKWGIYVQKQGNNRYARALPSQLAVVRRAGQTESKTVYIARTVEELESHLYSDPWIVPSDAFLAGLRSLEGETVRERFQFGLYIPQLGVVSDVGGYHLFAINLIETRRFYLVRHQTSPTDLGLLLKGPGAYKSDGLSATYGLIFKREYSAEKVFILVRIGNSEKGSREKPIVMRLGFYNPTPESVAMALGEIQDDEDQGEYFKTLEINEGAAVLGVRLQAVGLGALKVWEISFAGPSAAHQLQFPTREDMERARALKRAETRLPVRNWIR